MPETIYRLPHEESGHANINPYHCPRRRARGRLAGARGDSARRLLHHRHEGQHRVRKTAAGTSYNLYFLPGGAATYRDAVGHRVSGRWQLDRVGDVCVSWRGDTVLPAGCYRVRADGRELAWWNKQYPRSDETLRGAVINAFLTR
jgi:hypothetical protein